MPCKRPRQPHGRAAEDLKDPCIVRMPLDSVDLQILARVLKAPAAHSPEYYEGLAVAAKGTGSVVSMRLSCTLWVPPAMAGMLAA